MKSLKLYIDYMSQPCRAVLALSLLKKIPIELIEVRLNKKQVIIKIINSASNITL